MVVIPDETPPDELLQRLGMRLTFAFLLLYPLVMSGCRHNRDAGSNACFAPRCIGRSRGLHFIGGAHWAPACAGGEIVALGSL